SLGDCSACQVVAAYTRREPQIIFDSRTGCRLSSGPTSIQEESSHSLRCAVYSRGQTRGPCTDNDEVVYAMSAHPDPTQLFGNLPHLGISQHRSVLQNQCGQLRIGKPCCFEKPFCFRIALGIKPAVRNEIAC